eukprot:TRINITY_DN3805_c0_g2_i4.p1 TRINITY_DN3805_c0_g2~~TRINITY_DN3805_c0_g2_i4.p1  ORF type:complete len:873 (-),score=184.58 TRINITY_DN3805_c0_g2_i4:49-2667(-)
MDDDNDAIDEYDDDDDEAEGLDLGLAIVGSKIELPPANELPLPSVGATKGKKSTLKKPRSASAAGEALERSRAVVVLQSAYRGYATREQTRQRDAAVKIQKVYRGHFSRRTQLQRACDSSTSLADESAGTAMLPMEDTFPDDLVSEALDEEVLVEQAEEPSMQHSSSASPAPRTPASRCTEHLTLASDEDDVLAVSDVSAEDEPVDEVRTPSRRSVLSARSGSANRLFPYEETVPLSDEEAAPASRVESRCRSAASTPRKLASSADHARAAQHSDDGVEEVPLKTDSEVEEESAEAVEGGEEAEDGKEGNEEKEVRAPAPTAATTTTFTRLDSDLEAELADSFEFGSGGAKQAVAAPMDTEAAFKGHAVRQKIQKENEAATAIQRVFRGHAVRARMRIDEEIEGGGAGLCDAASARDHLPQEEIVSEAVDVVDDDSFADDNDIVDEVSDICTEKCNADVYDEAAPVAGAATVATPPQPAIPKAKVKPASTSKTAPQLPPLHLPHAPPVSKGGGGNNNVSGRSGCSIRTDSVRSDHIPDTFSNRSASVVSSSRLASPERKPDRISNRDTSNRAPAPVDLGHFTHAAGLDPSAPARRSRASNPASSAAYYYRFLEGAGGGYGGEATASDTPLESPSSPVDAFVERALPQPQPKPKRVQQQAYKSNIPKLKHAAPESPPLYESTTPVLSPHYLSPSKRRCPTAATGIPKVKLGQQPCAKAPPGLTAQDTSRIKQRAARAVSKDFIEELESVGSVDTQDSLRVPSGEQYTTMQQRHPQAQATWQVKPPPHAASTTSIRSTAPRSTTKRGGGISNGTTRTAAASHIPVAHPGRQQQQLPQIISQLNEEVIQLKVTLQRITILHVKRKCQPSLLFGAI